MDKSYYVIAGYDLTGFKTDKYNDWKWTEEGEKYTHYQRKGEIQLFNDPMNNEYLYLGYILASGDEYDFKTTMFNIADIERHMPDVFDKLLELQRIGIISNSPRLDPLFKIIVFEEWS